MTNIEHLVENAFSAVDNAEKIGADAFEAFIAEINKGYNTDMLKGVCMTVRELWEVVQYIKYTREMYLGDEVYSPMSDDDEIIKALECCIKSECSKCPLKRSFCSENVAMEYALDLINRQKAEIEKKDIEIDILIRKKDALDDEVADLQAEVECLAEMIRKMMEAD